MTVHCPHCASAYLLPDHLLGARGSRVRCPNCDQAFVVLREVEALPPEPSPELEPEPVQAPDLEPPGLEAASGLATDEPIDPESVARRLVDAVSDALGPSLDHAIREGRVLSEHGPDLLKAWDDYRALLGEHADAAAFRKALLERWGLDLGLGLARERVERGTG